MATSSLASTNAFTKQHATTTLAGGAVSIVFDDMGDFTLDGIQEGGKEAVRIFHRGVFKAAVYGQQVELSGSFSGTLVREAMTHATDLRPMDFLTKLGAAAAATNQNAGAFGPMLWTLTHALSATATASFALTNVRLTGAYNEGGDAGVWTINFTAVGITIA